MKNYRVLFLSCLLMTVCLMSCNPPDPGPVPEEYLAFQVIKFKNPEYAYKVLAVPAVQQTDSDSSVVFFKLNCTPLIACEKYYEVGTIPYINIGNGYFLVRWPWKYLASLDKNYPPVLLDVYWDDVTSVNQRWAFQDVSVIEEVPFTENYVFNAKKIDRIYGTDFVHLIRSGICRCSKGDNAYLDNYIGWKGFMPCDADTLCSDMYDHLINVKNIYEDMIINLFQNGEYKNELKDYEWSKGMQYISLGELIQ